MKLIRKPALRWVQRVGLALGVATLFQLGACQNFLGYTLGTTANQIPSNTYQTLFGLTLIPAEIGLNLLTGGSSSTGSGGGGSGGLGGIGGTGGLSNPVSTGGLGGLGTGGI